MAFLSPKLTCIFSYRLLFLICFFRIRAHANTFPSLHVVLDIFYYSLLGLREWLRASRCETMARRRCVAHLVSHVF
jgi:hypothetical protein